MRTTSRTVASLATLLVIIAAAPAAATGPTLWTDFRTSALQPADQLTLRVENPHGAGLVNTVLYAQGGVVEAPLAAVLDGPSTLAALVPGPVGQRRYYGFRLVAGQERDLLPVRLADGALPTPAQLTLLNTDPAGDEVFGRPHLDLVECRVSVSDTRLFAAVRNVSGGFPVSQSLTFFSYLFGIADPADPDPQVVWALLQTVSSPGIIEPGLYRVEGSGLSDLVKIGNVTVQEFAAENTLLLSCQLSDLLNDPALAAWFNPADPQLAVAAFTQRITVFGGAQEADRLVGGRLHLRAFSRDPVPSTLPTLSDLAVAPPGPAAVVEVVYTDAEAHCPVFAEVLVTGPGGTETHPLLPQSLDYAGAVVYRSATGIAPIVNGTWTEVEARVSDNASDVVITSLTITAAPDDAAGQLGVQLRLDGAPNPFTGQTVFSFRLPDTGPARLVVHDLAGRTVRVLVDGERPAGPHAVVWDGRDGQGRRQPAGVYVYRLTTRQGEVTRRVTLLR